MDVRSRQMQARLEGRMFPGGDDPVRAVRCGRYELRQELGVGGIGVVFAAYDVELRRDVAIKLLHPRASPTQTYELAQRRLLREARTLASLSHPNVVKIYDVGMHEQQVYLAMELVDGVDLRTWIEREEPAVAEVIAVLIEAGRGLDAAHRAGIVHRDFKPDNILVGRDGRARVLDFGLAKLVCEAEPPTPAVRSDTPSEPQITRTGSILGTPAYMAPEQYEQGEAGPAADQFAFCVTAWEMLAGHRPFAGRTLAELAENISHGRVRESLGVPPRLLSVLQRGLAARPEQRWPSTSSLIAALAVRSQRKRSANLLRTLALALLAVLLVGPPPAKPRRAVGVRDWGSVTAASTYRVALALERRDDPRAGSWLEDAYFRALGAGDDALAATAATRLALLYLEAGDVANAERWVILAEISRARCPSASRETS